MLLKRAPYTPPQQPRIGGEVVPHQDSSFLFTTPLSCIGIWLAIEDATCTNGCLWALPGSHKGVLARRFVRAPDGGVTFNKPAGDWPIEDGVALEVRAGTLVVLHGQLVHWSSENTSAVSRHAYSMHIVDGATEYARDNWYAMVFSDMHVVPCVTTGCSVTRRCPLSQWWLWLRQHNQAKVIS